MPGYKRFQQDDDDDDDNQQPDQQDQQQGDEDGDHDDQRSQTQQQQQEDEDDEGDNNSNAKARGVEGQQIDDDGDDDDNNASQRGQPQDDNDDDNDDDDDDDDDPRGKASQQQDDDEYDGTTRRELQQADDDDDDDDDVDDDDGQKATTSSNVNINFNINLGGDLEDSDLHEGGIIFSKKLLAQLFSGPGEHDPAEKEVPVHQVQHEHTETADSGEWTIVELKAQDANGATIYLKAKLDSGADDNFMSFDIYEVTGRFLLSSRSIDKRYVDGTRLTLHRFGIHTLRRPRRPAFICNGRWPGKPTTRHSTLRIHGRHQTPEIHRDFPSVGRPSPRCHNWQTIDDYGTYDDGESEFCEPTEASGSVHNGTPAKR